MFQKIFGGLVIIRLKCKILLMPCESFDFILRVVGEIFAKATKLAHFGVPVVEIGLSQT